MRRRQGQGFRQDRSGSVAVEFAMVVPLMAVLMLGLYQLWTLTTDNRQIQSVAASIAQMLTQTTTGTVTDTDLSFVTDSTMVLFPGVLTDAASKNIPWYNDIQITISSVVFAEQANGSYVAQVAWSRGSNKRPCGINLSGQDDTAPPSVTGLPLDLFGPGSLIVVDVSFVYEPTIVPTWFMASTSHTFNKSVYLQPRYIAPPSFITHKLSGSDGGTTTCQGFTVTP